MRTPLAEAALSMLVTIDRIERERDSYRELLHAALDVAHQRHVENVRLRALLSEVRAARRAAGAAERSAA